ncbi:PREDICTED: alpha-protein kinase 3 [Dipodomys ordii]|uniref:non-specific serine/threonine protein kinase n=1 Tax=Dipodomys ordii TaxID=10020 RepID=A0A1S3ETP3_DIPOR|nr:PREDICTED: alpha-protein kinase 3 [Dipodomys ordii]
MGSRRALSRGWALGGRAETGAGGDGEEDGPVWTPGPASRSYLLSVRPETSLSSSRLCHPSAGSFQRYEKTAGHAALGPAVSSLLLPLPSGRLWRLAVAAVAWARARSPRCSRLPAPCSLSGYPEPEVTWYKDDQELDRYCGLPKYQITHQGKRHTLQLFRCQEDDAAIYQASARNSKGIVSCSGVLEVGTMTEYKIHQRWFAKLKRKAAAKMREMGQSWRQGPEAAAEAEALRKLSPDRFQRKRRLSGGQAPVPPAPAREAEEETPAAWQEGEAQSAQHTGLGLLNSFAPGEAPTNGEPAPENGEDGEQGLLTYLCEAMELRPHRAPQKESGAKKKRKDEEPKPSPRRAEPDRAAPGQRPAEHCGSESPGPSREPELYFSLKDMYMESTQGHGPQEAPGSPPPGALAPGQSPPGKEDVQPRGEGAPAVPSPPTASLAPPPPRPFNRKRFAPPKPKGEPAATAPNTTTEPGARASGAAPPPASGQVPTPPARRRHGARDSPGQGRRTAGEVPESQAARSPRAPASGVLSPAAQQSSTDPMDTDAALAPGGRGGAQAPRSQAGSVPATTQSTQTGRETQDAERQPAPKSGRKDVETQRGQTPQEDTGHTRAQGEETGLSPPPGTPGTPRSQAPSTRLAESVLTPEVCCDPEKPGSELRSEEPLVTASINHGHTAQGPPPGSPGRPAQEGSPERAGAGEASPEDGGSQRPEELPRGHASQVLPTAPARPPQEEPRGTPASPHGAPDALLPSRHQALPSSAPTLHLGPGPPAQSLPQGPSSASHGGACARETEVEGGPPGARGCDPGLIDSLKNYLLLLLKLSSAEPGGPGAPVPAVAGLSPCTSRRILERVENEHLVQSAQTLLLSPATSRRLTGLLDHEVQAGRQALAAAQRPGPGPSPATIPAIVVGEDEDALEGPSPPESSQEQGLSEPAPENSTPNSTQNSTPDDSIPESSPPENSPPEPCQDEGVPGGAPMGLPAATPEELALGARRKRFLPKARAAADGEAAKPEDKATSPTVSPRGPRKSLAPGSPGTPGRDRHSPTQGRKGSMLEVPRPDEEPTAGDPGPDPKASGQDTEPGPEENKARKAKDLLKAPQVIRKIRVEQFPDASGSLKLWCQFFNVLSDSVLTWAKDQRPVGEVVLSSFVSREEAEVGEEIEMTPMVFAKGLADSGCWGDKLFGRLVSEEPRGARPRGDLRKASRARVIYGLEPIFESGRTCVIKVSSLLVFGPSGETSLLGRNYDVTIQGCKIQNMSREYCKIFAAEARAVPGFGEVPEIIPLHLIYRPANNIPYATLEEDLGEPLEPYCSREWGAGAPTASSSSEAMQKCRSFQHWLYQWTNGSFLVTDMAGVDWKMTDVQIATRLRGYQGLKESCFPALLDQFASSHQCNPFCEMLGLTPLKGPEAAHPPAKAKGSKSPSAGRKGPQLSPQPQKKPQPSPQGARKSMPSPKATPRASEAAAALAPGHPRAQEGGSKPQGTRNSASLTAAYPQSQPCALVSASRRQLFFLVADAHSLRPSAGCEPACRLPLLTAKGNRVDWSRKPASGLPARFGAQSSVATPRLHGREAGSRRAASERSVQSAAASERSVQSAAASERSVQSAAASERSVQSTALQTRCAGPAQVAGGRPGPGRCPSAPGGPTPYPIFPLRDGSSKNSGPSSERRQMQNEAESLDSAPSSAEMTRRGWREQPGPSPLQCGVQATCHQTVTSPVRGWLTLPDSSTAVLSVSSFCFREASASGEGEGMDGPWSAWLDHRMRRPPGVPVASRPVLGARQLRGVAALGHPSGALWALAGARPADTGLAQAHG